MRRACSPAGEAFGQDMRAFVQARLTAGIRRAVALAVGPHLCGDDAFDSPGFAAQPPG